VPRFIAALRAHNRVDGAAGFHLLAAIQFLGFYYPRGVGDTGRSPFPIGERSCCYGSTFGGTYAERIQTKEECQAEFTKHYIKQTQK